MITYNVLKEALQLLDTDDAKQAIAEIDELMQLDTDKDIWHNECFIISAFTADELMVETTYDVYSKLYDASDDHTVTFDQYTSAVRKSTLGPSDVTTSMMQLGYEIVESLHADNLYYGDDSQPAEVMNSIPAIRVNTAAGLLNRFLDICSDCLEADELAVLEDTFNYFHSVYCNNIK